MVAPFLDVGAAIPCLAPAPQAGPGESDWQFDRLAGISLKRGNDLPLIWINQSHKGVSTL
jgi:hypothetical protein